MKLRLWLTLLVSVVVGGCSTLVPAPVGPRPSPEAAQAAWARVLKGFVNEQGEVSFAALAQNPADLHQVVRHIADTPLERYADGDARLAHMINAYNALSMFNVVQGGIPDTHAGFKKVSFFVLRQLTVGGQPMSLRSFENDIIRPYARARNDPRIHFALNCSARACPVLPRVPFTATQLNAELERETRAFFARALNFRVDSSAQTVWLSELLDFYPEDFVPSVAPSLLAYANRYAPQPAPPEYRVMFTPYDWTVANSQAGAR